MNNFLIAAILVGSTIVGTSASALTAEQTVEREVIIKSVDGTEIVKREKAESVIPGENIVYSINYHNDLDKAAENVVLVMPVPSELVLIEGSADITGAETTYSADGGTTFTSRDSVVVKLEDNSTRVADTTDITHIKWTVASITPDQSGSLSFKGRLK